MGLAAAIGVAEVAFSVTAILESVTIVGAVLSVVGAVTKNPVLSKIGLVLGLVGGVGALASSELGIGSTALFGTQVATTAEEGASLTAGTVGAAADTAGGAAGLGASGGAIAGETGGAATTTLNAAGDVVINGAGAAPDLVGTLAQSDAADLTGHLALSQTGDTSLAATALNSTAANPTDAIATGASGAPAEATATGVAATTPSGVAADTFDTATADVANSGGGGFFSGLLKAVEAHPSLGLGVLQAGGNLLSGLTSTLTPAQVNALNAQAAQNEAASKFTALQTANVQSPKSQAFRTPVTGTPAPLVYSLGLINTAPQSPVTGGTT